MDGVPSVERAAIELVQSRYGAKRRQLRFSELAPHDFALCKIASAKSSGASRQNACWLPGTSPRLCTICLKPAPGGRTSDGASVKRTLARSERAAGMRGIR